MLCLDRIPSRDPVSDQSRIEIRHGGTLIEIVVLESVSARKVKVGINAPPEWSISRPDAVHKNRMAHAPRKDFR